MVTTIELINQLGEVRTLEVEIPNASPEACKAAVEALRDEIVAFRAVEADVYTGQERERLIFKIEIGRKGRLEIYDIGMFETWRSPPKR